jgi:hypothetical protein
MGSRHLEVLVSDMKRTEYRMSGVTMLHRNRRRLVGRFCTLIWFVATAVMLWKGLMVVSGSESPIVVMLR